MRTIARMDVKRDHIVKGKMLEGVEKKYTLKTLYSHLVNESFLARLGVDEIILHDSVASLYGWENQFLSSSAIPYVGLPVALGGGLRSVANAVDASKMAEKVVMNTINYSDTRVLSDASNVIGAQSVVAEVHVLKHQGRAIMLSENGKIQQHVSLAEHLDRLANIDFGELYVLSVSHDGMRRGLDFDLADLVVARFPEKSVVLGGGMIDVSDIGRAGSCGLSGVMCSSVFHDFLLGTANDTCN